MLFVEGCYDVVYDLECGCGTAVTCTEARLCSGEDVVGFEVVGVGTIRK